MTRMIAIAASFFFALGIAPVSSLATAPSAPLALVRVSVGIAGGRLKAYKQPRKGCFLSCLDSWACSGCCMEGGSIYRCMEKFLDCFSCCPNFNEWFNCNPDCCRSGMANGIKAGAQTAFNKDGKLVSESGFLGFGLGFGSSILSEPVEASKDDEKEYHYQKNMLAFLEVAALGQVTAWENWAVYLGGSIAGNPMSYGSEYAPFKQIFSKRRENRSLFQNVMYLMFGPEFRYSFNQDFSIIAGILAGFARVSNYIPQGEAADRILGVKAPYVTGAFGFYLGASYALNDDIELVGKMGRNWCADSGSRSFEGTSSKYINVQPCGTAYVNVGLSFAV